MSNSIEKVIQSLAEKRAIRKAMKKQKLMGIGALIISFAVALLSPDDWTILIIAIPVGLWMIFSKDLLLYVDTVDVMKEELKIYDLEEKGSH